MLPSFLSSSLFHIYDFFFFKHWDFVNCLKNSYEFLEETHNQMKKMYTQKIVQIKNTMKKEIREKKKKKTQQHQQHQQRRWIKHKMRNRLELK